jgi:hypothetical protein
MTTIRQVQVDGMNILAETGRNLLSSLSINSNVSWLILSNVEELEGAAGGAALSALLLASPHLTTLLLSHLPLGVEGAQALQPGLRGNQTENALGLDQFNVGDAGTGLIVDALQGNTTVKCFGLRGCGIKMWSSSRDAIAAANHRVVVGLYPYGL